MRAALVLSIFLGCSIGKASAAVSKPKVFSTSTTGLPEAIPSQEVRLKDGETYIMTAAPAKQKLNGQWIHRLAYNRMIPGPLLRVDQGASVKVILKNQLALDTTLHPHGLRGDPKNDGIPGIGQAPIKPGEQYEYVLTFKDYGMFWYHPHIRDDYTADSGLYGAIIVTPKGAEAWRPADREIFLILDDVDLSKSGRVYHQDQTTHTLMGRYGSTYLVNGSMMPSLGVEAGATLRLFVLNAANTRTFRFAAQDLPLTLVGGDHGRMQHDESVEAVSIGPGERYIMEAVAPAKPGRYPLTNQKPKDPQPLATLEVSSPPPRSLRAPPSHLSEAPRRIYFSNAEIKRYQAKAAGPVDFSLHLTVAMDHQKLPMTVSGGGHAHSNAPQPSPAASPQFYHQGRTTGVEWDDEMPAMNQKSNDGNVTWQMVDETTKKVNMAIDWSLKKDQLYLIRIKNALDSMHPMQHPIHFHGQRFLVMNVNAVPNPNLVWKDTVLLGAGDTADLILEASNSGRWMGHCHILEHIGAGMMMGFHVLE